jgi:hypothetical protein
MELKRFKIEKNKQMNQIKIIISFWEVQYKLMYPRVSIFLLIS